MSTEQYTWLITGADRGVGLEIVKLLLASPSNLILVPVYRTAPFGGLAMSAQGRLHLIPLDGDDGGRDDEDDEPLYGTVRLVSSIVGEGGIDYLLNYAVVTEAGWDVPSNMDLNALECDYRVNVIGPARAYQIYLPMIAKSKKRTVINVLSSQGKVATHGSASYTTTSITKAALKVLTRKESAESRHSTVVFMTLGHLRPDSLAETEVYILRSDAQSL
ncbi:NAD(P)-binding protein [Cubamyces sp. BRFM 1775]|nr:NAD(P)-binding protein [Cubamyces sp. BRFM 1775]